MNAIDGRLLERRELAVPVGVLVPESPLRRFFLNRLVPLKTIQPIRLLAADPAAPAAAGAAPAPDRRIHIADLAECTPEDFAALAQLMPELSAQSALMFANCRELAIEETHFEAVV